MLSVDRVDFRVSIARTASVRCELARSRVFCLSLTNYCRVKVSVMRTLRLVLEL